MYVYVYIYDRFMLGPTATALLVHSPQIQRCRPSCSGIAIIHAGPSHFKKPVTFEDAHGPIEDLLAWKSMWKKMRNTWDI